jgi:cytosine deaminase
VPEPSVPIAGSYRLKNATVPACLIAGQRHEADADGLARVDIRIAEGRIAGIAPAARQATEDVELAGRMLLPAFVDCHTHLDKGHILPRMPNPDGSFLGALDAAAFDRTLRWTAADVERRMDFALRCAYAHGTSALRTHIDSIPPQDAISWPVFEEMRRRWAGRITLQGASLVTIELVRERARFEGLADRVAAAGGVLGAATFPLPDLPELLDVVFHAAAERGLDLDFHADETHDPASAALDAIAETALRLLFPGRVLVGHCCSLARQPDDCVLRTLDKAAHAGLSIVSLPMCNLYLQDRRCNRTTPRWRGVTLAHEMRARGIPVAVASDNTRDPFYPQGDLDMLEVFRMASRILHLDHPVGDWPCAVSSTPAAAMGLAGLGMLVPGGPADFNLFRGRNWSELLSRPESGRTVVRNGRAIDTTLPEYAELDDLMRG